MRITVKGAERISARMQYARRFVEWARRSRETRGTARFRCVVCGATDQLTEHGDVFRCPAHPEVPVLPCALEAHDSTTEGGDQRMPHVKPPLVKIGDKVGLVLIGPNGRTEKHVHATVERVHNPDYLIDAKHGPAGYESVERIVNHKDEHEPGKAYWYFQ